MRIRHHIDKLPSWLPTVLTLAVILWLTLARKPLGDTELPLFPGADKIVHALMFGFLTVILLLDHSRSRGWSIPTAKRAAVAALSSTALGVAIEFMQKWMHAGRGFEIADMIADLAGSVIAATLVIILSHRHT